MTELFFFDKNTKVCREYNMFHFQMKLPTNEKYKYYIYFFFILVLNNNNYYYSYCS